MLRWAFGLIVLLVSALPASAGWDGWWWQRLPACGDHGVLHVMAEQAAWAEHNTWHRGWVVSNITNTGETALDPGPSKVHRRYCRGTAWLSNGRRTDLVYLIEADLGFVSIGWKVEFCMPAYDPWRIGDEWCRAIRP